MILPNEYNYIGLFLTMRCNNHCSYCINWKSSSFTEKDGKYWISNLNNIETDLPITIGGGEPSLHIDFFNIIRELQHKVHLLTNLQFDPFLLQKNKITPDRFDTTKPFAPIRVSHHAQMMNEADTLEKVKYLYNRGYKIAIYIVNTEENHKALEFFSKFDWLDLQTKPLLDNTKITGKLNEVKCRTKELLLAPDGQIYKCHRNLYLRIQPLGLLHEQSKLDYMFRYCNTGESCHPCDLKSGKRDRFGKEGYFSVEKEKL